MVEIIFYEIFENTLANQYKLVSFCTDFKINNVEKQNYFFSSGTAYRFHLPHHLT